VSPAKKKPPAGDKPTRARKPIEAKSSETPPRSPRVRVRTGQRAELTISLGGNGPDAQPKISAKTLPTPAAESSTPTEPRLSDPGQFAEISLPPAAPPATALPALPYPLPDHGGSLPNAELQRFSRGEHLRLWEILGAHLTSRDDVAGVRFAVWAPNARDVSVIGDFNRWEPGKHAMAKREPFGVWELFVPGVEAGQLYKFHVEGWQGMTGTKCDPVGFYAELRPNTASRVTPLAGYAWRDEGWMSTRAERQKLDQPILIYEVHAGSWKRGPRAADAEDDDAGRFLSWRELADQLIPYARDLGYTHLELMPVTEHPLDQSWGYQTIGYFAPTSRFGSADDFRHFVDRAHQAGLGVILDWVPAHFPRDAHGLSFFDGTHLYEHADPRQGAHQEWGTLIFNYGRPQVSDFLLSSAAYWLEHFHVDGLRVDAVASMLYLNYARGEGEWIPNRFGGVENLEAIEFLRAMNAMVHERYPGVLTFAEESTSWAGVTRPVHLGGLGFDLKWNLGWMHDNLDYLKLDPIFRKSNQDRITFSIWYAWHERWLLPLSHDEVVHGKASLVSKMPGDRWRRFASLRLLLAHMAAHPGKKLLFMGGEIAQWREWSEERSLDWDLLEHEPHQGVQRLVRELNAQVARQRALHQVDFETDGFQWIDFRDIENSVLAYVRYAKDREDFVIVANNYTPIPRHGYRIGVPAAGRYEEILNTDAAEFSGSGVRNGPAESEAVEFHGLPQSITISLPPLGSVWLRRSAT
jgi:1,4-alpha-glucan branching enzyme